MRSLSLNKKTTSPSPSLLLTTFNQLNLPEWWVWVFKIIPQWHADIKGSGLKVLLLTHPWIYSPISSYIYTFNIEKIYIHINVVGLSKPDSDETGCPSLYDSFILFPCLQSLCVAHCFGPLCAMWQIGCTDVLASHCGAPLAKQSRPVFLAECVQVNRFCITASWVSLYLHPGSSCARRLPVPPHS